MCRQLSRKQQAGRGVSRGDRLMTRRRAPHGLLPAGAALAEHCKCGGGHSSRLQSRLDLVQDHTGQATTVPSIRKHPATWWDASHGCRGTCTSRQGSNSRCARQQVSWTAPASSGGGAVQSLQGVPCRAAMQPHAVMDGQSPAAAAAGPPSQAGQEGVGPYVRWPGQGVQDLHFQLGLGGCGLCHEDPPCCCSCLCWQPIARRLQGPDQLAGWGWLPL